MSTTLSDAARVAALARRRPAKVGSTRVIVIDGPAGSGKTTLAAALAAELSASPQVPPSTAPRTTHDVRLGEVSPTCADVPQVHMDDLMEGWQGLEGSFERLESQVLRPLSLGEVAACPRYDWVRARFAEPVPIAPGPFLIVEGCGAGRVESDAYTSVLVWVEADQATCLSRGLARDGDAMRPEWLVWQREERDHFARHRTRERADLRFTT